MTLRKLSLCSGIGGDDLASEWAGIKTIAFVENNKYCQSVLRKHWPGIPIIEDVQDVTRESIAEFATDACSLRCDTGRAEQSLQGTRESSGTLPKRLSGIIDIISGGFPCQPHSVAGRHQGASDERNLWPEVRRILGEIKPRWFVGENVPGLFSSDNGVFYGGVLSDLASLGYIVGWCCYGANDVGAWHKRDRIFIVAYANSQRQQQCGGNLSDIGGRTGNGIETIIPHANVSGLERAIPERTISAGRLPAKCDSFRNPPIAGLPDWAGGTVGQPRPLTEFERPSGREIELSFCGMAYGISRRVDRLKSLGNAVVPQQIYPVYRAIVEYESRPAGPEAR